MVINLTIQHVFKKFYEQNLFEGKNKNHKLMCSYYSQKMDEWNGGWLNIWADGSMCTVTVHYNNNIFSISTVYHFLPK